MEPRGKTFVRGATTVLLMGGVACSSIPRGTVRPLVGDHFEATAVSEGEEEAREGAYAAASRDCSSRGAGLKVLEERNSYRGMDRETRAGLAVAGALLGNMVGSYGAGTAASQARGTTVSDEDYRTTLVFRCGD